jgi:drug/metabolite transporter, DME family
LAKTLNLEAPNGRLCAPQLNFSHIGQLRPMTRPFVGCHNSYWGGCGLVIAGGLILSLGILCLRAASASDAWQYLFWRGIGFGCALSVLAAWRHASSPLAQIKRLGAFAWISVAALVASQVLFVAAIKSGSTAEVFFLMSLAPLMAAVLARPLLGEQIGIVGVLAIAVALGGVALMNGLSFNARDIDWTMQAGPWLARTLALGTAFTFALYSLATRSARAQDLDGALVVVGIVTALVCAIALLWFGLPIAASLGDVALALLHGGVILALGLVLLARGSRVVPGVTLVMLAQAETVAAPIWTYLFFNETTTLAVIVGGGLILIAVLMQASAQAQGRPRSPGATERPA